MKDKVEMRLVLPKEINIKLRKYVMDYDKKNKELAVIYILKNFLNRLYTDFKIEELDKE
jgi:hypothetical protein